MLIQLGILEQRHKAVVEVLEGLRWLRCHEASGLPGLPTSPRALRAVPANRRHNLEERILELRREHPRCWRRGMTAVTESPCTSPLV